MSKILKITIGIISILILLLAGNSNSEVILDPGFGEQGRVRENIIKSDFNDQIANAVIQQQDGKLLIAGSSNNSRDNNIILIRYGMDGEYDLTFGKSGVVTTELKQNESASSLVQQFNGKIVVAATSRAFNAPHYDKNNDLLMLRYNLDGTLDKSFGLSGIVEKLNLENETDVYSVIQQFDGKLVVVGGSRIFRLNNDGSLDIRFAEQGQIVLPQQKLSAVIQQSDKKLVVHGKGYVSRYLPAGEIDMSFGVNGVFTYDDSSNGDGFSRAHSIVQQLDGKLLILGEQALLGLTVDGNLDIEFGIDGKVSLADENIVGEYHALTRQADGKILITGHQSGPGDLRVPTNDLAIVRLLSNGNLDETFGEQGIVKSDIYGNEDSANAIILQTDDKIIVAGKSYSGYCYGPHNVNLCDFDSLIVRYDSSGVLDDSFGQQGVVTDDKIVDSRDFVTDVIKQTNGKLIATGSSVYRKSLHNQGIAVGIMTRFEPDGSLDTSFNDNVSDNALTGRCDTPLSVIEQTDGKIVIAGTDEEGLVNIAVCRFNSDGTADITFGSNGVVENSYNSFGNVLDIVQQSNGALVIATHNELLRLNQDGSRDLNFGTNGFAEFENNSQIFSVHSQPDDKLIVAGRVGSYNNSTHGNLLIKRFNSDGSLDGSFQFENLHNIQAATRANYFQLSNGDFIVGAGLANESFSMIKFKSDGSLDSSFGVAGLFTIDSSETWNEILAMRFFDNGDSIFAVSILDGGNTNFGLLRYTADGNIDSDFGNNGVYQYNITARDFLKGAILEDEHFYLYGRSYADLLLTKVTDFQRVELVTQPDLELVEINEDSSYNLEVLSSNKDGDLGNWQWALGQVPTRGEVDISINDNSIDISYIPATNYYGSDNFDIYFSNNQQELDSIAFDFSISPVNDAPTGTVIIQGDYIEDQLLTATQQLADVEGLGDVNYSWYRDSEEVASGSNYLLGDEDVAKSIYVVAAYIDEQGSFESKSSDNHIVGNINDEPTGEVSISGPTIEGSTLSASNTLVDLDGIGDISYIWKRNNQEIAVGDSYTIMSADVGHRLVVNANYTDSHGTPESKTSPATERIQRKIEETVENKSGSGTFSMLFLIVLFCLHKAMERFCGSKLNFPRFSGHSTKRRDCI